MTREEAREKLKEFYQCCIEKIGGDRTAALRLDKTNPIITHSEMYEAVLEDKYIEGYGNPLDRYITLKNIKITE